MIQIKINDEIIKKHEEFIFGENALNDNRLLRKLKVVYENENNKYARNVYRYIIENIREIILGDIETLSRKKQIYSYLINSIPDKKIINKIIESLEIFKNEYKYFYKSTGWNAYLYQKALGINICPYCATQFIFIYNSDSGNTRGTLDHFIDKAKYPIFSVSLYNLVPSCKVCNSDFKGSKEANIIKNYTPFEENIIDYMIFKRDIIQNQDEEISPSTVVEIKKKNKSEIDYVSMFLGINEDFNIKIDYSDAPSDIALKIKGNLELFHIEEIYNAYHKSYVQDSIRKASLYNHIYRIQLLNSFSQFFQSEEELRVAIMPSVEDDRKNILGKLTRDIIYQETNRFTL